MGKVNFYQKEKEVNGKKYIAQFNGVLAALRAADQSYIGVNGTTTTSNELLGKYILENVIVEPKGLSFDDFESIDEYNEVLSFGRDVMQGTFRDEKKQREVKENGKK